jgi:hypothetical protein
MKRKILIILLSVGLILFLGNKLIKAQTQVTPPETKLLQAELGDVVLLSTLNDEVRFFVSPKVDVVVKMIEYEGGPYKRVKFLYKEVDKSGNVLVERYISYGPEDIGGEIEVIKTSPVPHALITVPISQVWPGVGKTGWLGKEEKPAEVKRLEEKPAKMLSEGDLVSSPEGKIYRLENNKLRYISSPEVMKIKGYKWSEVKSVPLEVINQYEKGEPIVVTPIILLQVELKEGDLVKTPDKSTVYVLENGTLKPIASPSVMEKYGYSWNKIITVPEEKIKNYPVGEIKR